MFEIMICPLKRLYLLSEDGEMDNVAVLAVSSGEIRYERLTGFSRTLCLRFDDITNETNAAAFTPRIAAQIAAYVKSLPPELDTLFVCCDSGESRSTAMAAAITRYLGGDEMAIWTNPHYHPNSLVYRLLCTAFGVVATETEVQKKLLINKRAFSAAIRR